MTIIVLSQYIDNHLMIVTVWDIVRWFPSTTNTQSKTQKQQSTNLIPQTNVGYTEEMDSFYLSQPPRI